MQIRKNNRGINAIEVAHCSRLSEIHANNCETFKNGLDYLAMTLAALRDRLILEDNGKPAENINLIALTAAVEEYKKYAYCANRYFFQSGGAVKAISGSDEEASEKYLKEKQAHLTAFCDIVKENLLAWEAEYAEFQ